MAASAKKGRPRHVFAADVPFTKPAWSASSTLATEAQLTHQQAPRHPKRPARLRRPARLVRAGRLIALGTFLTRLIAL